MRIAPSVRFRAKVFVILCGVFFLVAPTFAQSNVTVRVMAANLSSGNNQRYESPGLNIFKGLKPDVVCIQEFNYASTNGQGINTTNAIREMIDTTFGTNYSYYRETTAGYSIPNGIISRYPILTNGTWDDGDNNINDRGFAWARIDLPGTNDLYVVSVHLKASSGSANETRRAAQVVVLKSLIQTNFPANAWIVVGGDMNTYSQTEPCMTNFVSFLSDTPSPADQSGDADTNASRAERYDRVMFSFSFTNTQVPVVIGANTFSNGLVFDSRVYTPLTDVAPVVSTDSGVTGMQHMGIVKNFRYSLPVTNLVVPAPVLVVLDPSRFTWTGVSNVTYTVQTKTNLLSANWTSLGTVTSTTTNFAYTNLAPLVSQRFYLVSYP